MATLHLGFKNREQGGGGTIYLEVEGEVSSSLQNIIGHLKPQPSSLKKDLGLVDMVRRRRIYRKILDTSDSIHQQTHDTQIKKNENTRDSFKSETKAENIYRAKKKICREFDRISAVYPNCGPPRITTIANKLENAGNFTSKYPSESISFSQSLDKNESRHMNRLQLSPFSSSSSTSADDYFLQEESDESFHENKVSSQLFGNRDRLRNDLFSPEKPKSKSKLQKGKQGSLLNPDRPKLRKKRGFTKYLTETSDTPCQCEILTSQLTELRNKLDKTLLENSKLEELIAKLTEPVSLTKSHLLEDNNFSDHFEEINFEDFLDVSFNSSNPSGKQSLERSSPDGEAVNDNKDSHDDSDSTIKELDETLEMKSIGKPEISDEDTNEGLQSRVKELEETLEMIQEEFELMEDYWQDKLKKEREFYIQQLDVTEGQLDQLEARIQHNQLIIRMKQRTVLEPVLERMDLEAEVEVRETEINQLRIQVEELTQELTDIKHQI